MCQKALDRERSNGGERAESKCRKDKDNDLWYGAGSPAEFRRVLICQKEQIFYFKSQHSLRTELN